MDEKLDPAVYETCNRCPGTVVAGYWTPAGVFVPPRHEDAPGAPVECPE